MRTVKVALDERSYDIVIERGLLAQAGQRLAALIRGRQVVLVSDSNVAALYGGAVRQSLEVAGFEVLTIAIPAGENSKSWQQAEQILAAMLTAGYHRDCCVVALGGGVVGDLAGFVAAIYQRGVDFVQLPTSLLAQVDSSVGGKVAVNHALGKNMIGAFYQPKAVWIDLDCLETLPRRQWQSGMAEVAKYGFIADKDFLDFLTVNHEAIKAMAPAPTAEMIARCCRIKADIVARDEREGGLRALLNFGHTIGHGLEIATHYDCYHGEAVAMGMALAAVFAWEQGYCDRTVPEAVAALLRQYQLPTALPAGVDLEQVLAAMALDKKVSDGQWVFVFLTGLGKAAVYKGIAQTAVRDFLYRLQGGGRK